MSNFKNLVGNEKIVAECSGLNYDICVTESRLLVGKKFTLGQSYVNVPHANVSTLELITKSILPTLTLSIVASIGVFAVWWFPGERQILMPVFPYNLVLISLGLMVLAGLVASAWRRRVAVLRIGIVGTNDPITVKLVSTAKAESVFRALKG